MYNFFFLLSFKTSVIYYLILLHIILCSFSICRSNNSFKLVPSVSIYLLLPTTFYSYSFQNICILYYINFRITYFMQFSHNEYEILKYHEIQFNFVPLLLFFILNVFCYLLKQNHFKTHRRSLICAIH